MFHGLEGSSTGHYSLAMADEARRRGWAYAVPHFRGCSGELNRGPRAYHSGDFEEIGWILRRLRERAGAPVIAVGISLGGTMLLNAALAEPGVLDGLVCTSSPLDLAACSRQIERPRNRIYQRWLLRRLRDQTLADPFGVSEEEREAEAGKAEAEGADTRKAAQICEVSLLLTECEKQLGSEFHEIEITRRVHRDGQSEYAFNGQPCRLKDIQKLFMDTGVGRTSYSIMAQGQIDQILSSKPEERRAVFEEAAGITKYKSQRREALQKLSLTDQNLARVADVIGEVSRQIGSLRRQAAKAMRFKRLSHRLRHLALAWSGRQHSELAATLAELESLVTQMETGDLTLEHSLAAFERGVRLTRQCQAALRSAELRIRQLTEDDTLEDLGLETLDDE